MHDRKRLFTALVLAATLSLGPVPAVPQEGDDYTFFETVEVEVVNVEVVVTGPDGAPVQGLTREDFELLDDGKPVEMAELLA